MSKEGASIRVTAKVRIKKYAEGVDPGEGQPFEVVEQEVLLTPEQVEKFMGGKLNATN